MRQENYLIALFNKELLNLRVPLPRAVKRFTSAGGTGKDDVGQGRMLTRALEWNLRFCLMEYLFDAHGRVRKVFLKHKNRTVLIEGYVLPPTPLRKKEVTTSVLQLKEKVYIHGNTKCHIRPIHCPLPSHVFIFPILRRKSVPFPCNIRLTGSQEYHKNPSSIGGRKYTPFARWKFREFNELPHLYERRLRESYPAASMYIGQFPNEKMTLIVRCVAFSYRDMLSVRLGCHVDTGLWLLLPALSLPFFC